MTTAKKSKLARAIDGAFVAVERYEKAIDRVEKARLAYLAVVAKRPAFFPKDQA